MRPIIAALLAAVALGRAEAAPPLTWLTTDLPPQFIYAGEMEGQGAGDLQTRFLIRRLPQFRHVVVAASFSRIWHDIGRRDGICTIGALRSPEREKMAVFSDRPVPISSYHLIADAGKLDRFRPYTTDNGEVDLEKLAADPSLRGGYVQARRHSAPIDAFIGAPDRKAPLEATVSTLQVFHLMRRGRLDFIFALPFEISYYRRISRPAERIAVLPIRNSPKTAKSYIACSDLAEGRAAIAAIDALLRSDRNWGAFLSPMKRWMAPAEFAAALATPPED